MATTRLLSAMVATWNNVATTFTGLKLNVTDTASASGSLLLDLQVDGSSKFNVRKNGEVVSAVDFWVKSNGATSGFYLGTSADVFLARDAANTLALRNGTAAQKFSVYNTYTDASNYERGVFDWAGTANTLRIGTEAAGTGTVRNIQLVAGSNSVTATVGASNLLTLNGGLTTGGLITSGSSFVSSDTGALVFGARSRITSPIDSNVLLRNNGGTAFNLLQFGGTTSSFPAIKRNTTNIEIRLADDSARSGLLIGALNAGGEGVFGTYVKTQSTTVAGLTAAATAGAGARSFVTDANTTKALGDGTIVVGGGANAVPVYSDGTNWLIG